MNSKRISSSPILALVGPTAIGKTKLSIELAEKFGCEIVSVDSMQVYRFMDIGTAKITEAEKCGVPHHLIDIVTPDEQYDAAKFVHDATVAIREITGRNKLALLTGGTGLYLKALVDGLAEGLPEDKEIREELQLRLAKEGASKLHEELSLYDQISAERIHPNDEMRLIRGLEIYHSTGVPWSTHLLKEKGRQERSKDFESSLIVGLTCERDRLYGRINHRVEIMLEQGLEEEVRGLLERGYSRDLKSMGAIGYRHMLNFIFQDWGFEEMKELLARDTRRYAKRQFTWFSKVNGLEWYEVGDSRKIIDRVAGWLNDLNN